MIDRRRHESIGRRLVGRVEAPAHRRERHGTRRNGGSAVRRRHGG
ncbi:hypothetical protein Ae263Ps1_4423c [Pseudonocardia sp. Ae263_Ps1]|nr:hypothetical protein Ae150APs1_0913 [Pseudonocardia sp. Ae150A_Ps1]OLL87368.1 hypothetical protein Ae263Ps1_4423c [Pseudonocardia sp. Ae263_Ps1]OLL92603.1 hypothetical protein Ae356Ps1_2500 [Pseudonocardia sp. Ae356_Ps1]